MQLSKPGRTPNLFLQRCKLKGCHIHHCYHRVRDDHNGNIGKERHIRGYGRHKQSSTQLRHEINVHSQVLRQNF